MPHTFLSDIDQIARNLIDAFDLRFEEHEPHLSDPLLRWLDYRLRCIDVSPRRTVKSLDFDLRLPLKAKSSLEAFIHRAESGADLNPYLTKTIKRNDSSGEKRQNRTDALWASWGIHHAHLPENPDLNGDFSHRADWLVFFVVSTDQLALIDVRSHGEVDLFQAIDLVEMAIRSWPDFAEPFRVKGTFGLRHAPARTAEDLKQLRVGGVNQMLEVDGRVYMPPGFGLTTAATPTLVTLRCNRVRSLAQAIGYFFTRPAGEALASAAIKGVTNPVFSLELLARGLVVSCSEAGLAWPFPFPPNFADARSELEHWLVPPWAAAKLQGA